MALFKVFRGQRKDLDNVTKIDGHAYFCTDDGTFWVDYLATSGTVVRVQINKEDWNKDIVNNVVNMELITTEDIDRICNTIIQDTTISEVTF